jgi:hypothetical protein
MIDSDMTVICRPTTSASLDPKKSNSPLSDNVDEVAKRSISKNTREVRFDPAVKFRVYYGENEKGEGLPVECPDAEEFPNGYFDVKYTEKTIDSRLALEETFVPAIGVDNSFDLNLKKRPFRRERSGSQPRDAELIKEVIFLYEEVLSTKGQNKPPNPIVVLKKYNLLLEKSSNRYSPEGDAFKRYDPSFQAAIMSKGFQTSLFEALSLYQEYLEDIGVLEEFIVSDSDEDEPLEESEIEPQNGMETDPQVDQYLDLTYYDLDSAMVLN